MNILVIFTGGTIGSHISDGYISPDEVTQYTVIKNFMAKDDSMTKACHFDTIHPYNILSENLGADHINTLKKLISGYLSTQNEEPSTDYDGIIITHGTDTLQYMAAALGLSFPQSDIPIVLVSSNYILEDERANGVVNFRSAVELIHFLHNSTEKTGGVYAAYCNHGGTPVIHHATRLLPHTPYDDSLYSVGNCIYGTITDGVLKAADAECVTSMGFSKYDYGKICLVSPSPVLYLRPIPGQSFPLIPENIKAILLDTYHSGTLCTSDNSLEAFVSSAQHMCIPVFLTGIDRRISYESTRIYNDIGLITLPKASPVAMYMKLWFLTSASCQGDELITEMQKEIGCEFI